jgi:hypothetical protein
VNAILNAAQVRKASVQYLTPTHLSSAPVSYETDGHARVLFITDQTERSPSLGLAAFSENVLAKHLCKTTVVMSAEPDAAQESLIAALLMFAPDPRLVIVMTSPKHHVEWTNKVAELSGAAPVLHIADEDVDLSGMKSLYIDLRGTGATKWVN